MCKQCGYYSGTNGKGTKYYNADGTSARTWNIASNTTLYEKWISEEITYIVVSNSFSCANKTVGIAPYLINYTGNCSIHDDGNDNWKIKFLTSSTLTLGSNIKLDLFAVGGGGGARGSGGF